ncbi:MAG: pentapeptide repeat-containing protein [Pseudomonadota bacterium]
MADSNHLSILKKGRNAWNKWRETTDSRPNLREAKLARSNLAGFNLRDADLRGARLEGALLRGVELGGADLQKARLKDTVFRSANLERADLRSLWAGFAIFSRANLAGADLSGSDFVSASFRRANLTDTRFDGANLRFVSMVEARVQGASFAGAQVYGISAWSLKGEPGDQRRMIIRADKESVATTVDDLDTAQFLFLLRDNPKFADVIDTASSRVVLILGRFAPRHKRILEGVKDHLLRKNFVPVLFDFNKPASRDLTETIASLAHMACFVVVDLTGAKSVPQELSFIVPSLPSVPVCPILHESDGQPYAMFEHFKRYPWVRETILYRDLTHLLSVFDQAVLKPAYQQAMKVRGQSARLPRAPSQP